MSGLLEQAASPEVLNSSWKYLRNDKAVWGTGISRKEMEKDFVFHIIKLADDLKTGQYKPDPVRFFPISKGDGKKRIISSLTLRDKLAQRAVLKVIEPLGENIFHPNSFGYRPGRNIDMAISKVREYVLCGFHWLLDADIQSYFDNIPQRCLLKKIKKLISDQKLLTIIKKWLDSGTISQGILSSPKGIPQGAILSPFLCNVYLTSWDNAMMSKSLTFVRFADDFIVFTKSQNDAEKAHKFVKKTLRKLGLFLNIDKTQVAHCSPKISFLGKKLPDTRKIKLYTPSS
ncbi:MAG: Retron-type reverse transcriptase [Desulfobacula sp.]|nr:Retron-type reverse transcriptase [Desulfobacula sp.]